MRRKTIIGTSVGAASLLILVILAFLLVMRNRRQKSGKLISHEDSRPPVPSENPRVLSHCSVREIDNNSMCGPVRELSNTAKAELQDEQTPSGSGNEISEMYQPLPPIVHELKSHMTSRQHSMVQTHTVNTGRIFMSTRISRKSETSLTSFDSIACVETVISASAHRENLDSGQASVYSSNAEAEIYALYMRKSLNLDRSLPPTPISESPQTSPVVIKFDRGNSFRPRPQIVRTPARGSMSAIVSLGIPTSRYSLAPRRHQRLPAGVLLTGLETVIPPGQSDPTTPRTLVSSPGYGTTNQSWF